MRRCKRRVCKRKTFFAQPNGSIDVKLDHRRSKKNLTLEFRRKESLFPLQVFQILS